MRNLIVIPAYNEQEALPKTLESLQALGDEFELLIINDGSTDATLNVARQAAAASRLKAYLVNMPSNCGIGATVQTGYLFAEKCGGYDYVIQFDADGQHDAASLARLVAECRAKELDLCVGSRFLSDENCGFRSTFARRMGSRFFAGLISLLSGVKVTDPTSGLRCAGARAARSFARFYPDDYPEPESLFWCARNKLRIGEIPVRMHERQGGASSIRYLNNIYYMLKVSLAILVDSLRIREFHDQ